MEPTSRTTSKSPGHHVDHGLNAVLHTADAGLGHSSTNHDTIASKGENNQESKPLLNSRLPTIPSLTMPKGGGAIQGVGEKFSVNLSNGTGSLAVPIRTSSGRSIQPSLSLVYDSGSGNSEFGLGWSLKGCDSITRKTSKGLPQYKDDQESDVFLLSGSEDLVPLLKTDSSGKLVLNDNGDPQYDELPIDNYSVRRYMPRIVESHLRIERWTRQDDPSDIHWRVTSTDNVVTIFGSSSATRIYDVGAGPDESPRIYSWLCAETWDPQGNAMLFNYQRENSVNIPLSQANEINRTIKHRAANLYLKSIQYGNVEPNRDLETWAAFSAFQLSTETWKFSVVFDYGDHDANNPKPQDKGEWLCRLDPFSHYRPGYEVRTYRLCRRVLMFHHFLELGSADVLVSSTDVQYDENRTCTYLKSVEQVGYMPTDPSLDKIRRIFPPVEFEYSRFPTDDELGSLLVQAVDQESLENLPIGLNATSYRWLDLDGEGISGILAVQDQCWYYKRNLSSPDTPPDSQTGSPLASAPRKARFGSLEMVNAAPFLSMSSQGMHFGDINGNGKLDVISHDRSCWGYFERDEKEDLGWSEFHPFADFPQGLPHDRSMQLVDLTGDGLADILVLEDQVYSWHASKGSDGYLPPQSVTQPNNETSGPVCVFADSEQNIYLADMSGDGMMDLVRIRNGSCCYWPNLGYGKFGNQVNFDNAPCFDGYDQFNPSRIRIADIDGSGTNDLLYCRSDSVDIYMNQSGNSFAEVKKISFPQFNQHTLLDTIDLLGTGTTCLVWSSSLPINNGSPMQYVDLCRGQKPHLLSTIMNNLGSETYLAYASSTKFYLEDKLNDTPWITRLPFPVHCIESMESIDRISGNRFKTRYHYKHGFYDGLEREFRGFARVDQVDATTFSSEIDAGPATNINTTWTVPPVQTVTWFHTGAYIDRESVSLLLSKEYFENPSPGITSGSDGRQSLLSEIILPRECIEGAQQREACRSVKGKVIRTEIFGLDGTDKEKLPYSVQQANFNIVAMQPLQDRNFHGVYQVHARESVTIQYDRQLEDPRISHTMALETDPYGNNKKDLKVAYGRVSLQSGIDPRIQNKQKTHLILYQETDYTDPLLGAAYRTPLPCEARQYEISGLETPTPGSRFRYDDLVADSFTQILSIPPSEYETEIQLGKLQRRLVRRERVRYRKDDLTDLLPLGKVESMGLPGKKYELAFSPGLLPELYQKRTGTGVVNMISDYSATLGGFGEAGAGYVDIDRDGYWWKTTGHLSYSASSSAEAAAELAEGRRGFFMPKTFVDIFGNVSSTVYDDYKTFPIATKDAVGNNITLIMDYRVLQPKMIIDANGNRTAAAYDALGLSAGTAVMGKPSDNVGDTVEGLDVDISQDTLDNYFADPSPEASARLLGKATTRIVYDLWRAGTGKDPIYSVLIAREEHVNGPVPPDGRQYQVAFTYSDGFGRTIQSKSRTKSGPMVENGPVIDNLWIGTGWTVFNNKGNTVKQFEPFFDTTHKFQNNMMVGVSPTFFYDPVGRVVATLRPDHAVSKAIFSPWSEAAFDVNDTVMLSDPKTDPDVGFLFEALPEAEYLPSWHDARIGGQLGPQEQDAATKAVAHDKTPKRSYFDPLGRPVLVVSSNGSEDITASIDLDIQGNATANRDPLDRITLKAKYDMCSRRIFTASIDAGEAWILHDALDHALMRWNSRNFRFRSASDELRRVTRSWVQEGNSAEILYQENIFGERAPDTENRNLRGGLWKIRDQAGVAVHETFDFKGNLTSSSRQLHANYKDLLDLSQTVEVDAEVFAASSTYDALNRPLRSTAPDGTIMYRIYDQTTNANEVYANIKCEQDPSSDPRTWTPMLLDCQYNANGQTTMTKHGNRATTFRSYDHLLYRLQRLRSVRESGAAVQDLTYTYDAVGNVTNIKDAAQQTVYFRNTVIDASCNYTYDPTYRLISATGREHLGQTGGRPVSPGASDNTHVGNLSPGDGNAMGRYTENYRYDKAGNVLSIQHLQSDGQTPGWTRNYSYEEFGLVEQGVIGNRLSSTTVGSVTEKYKYEGSAGLTGNMTSMTFLPLMRWDYAEQLRATSRQVVNEGAVPETTYYVYDALGRRVRKITESQASAPAADPGSNSRPVRLKERIYLDDFEVFRKYKPNGTDIAVERTTFHVGESSAPLAKIERRTRGTDERVEKQVRFQYSNLLGSVCVELDDEGQVLSYEEYFPYGSTSYQATAGQIDNTAKRYRYTNKELDVENGLYYFGSRYYAAWLGRWTSCDPAAGPRNNYDFVSNNPIHLVDPDGNQAHAAAKKGGASFSSLSGTTIHTILTYVLRARLALMGVHSAGPVRTLPGGSKNAPQGTTSGEIDIAPLAPRLAGDYAAHVYEIKPAAKVPRDSTAYRKSSETQLYADKYPLGLSQTGQNVVSAKVGTMLEDLAAINPSLMDPVTYSNAKVDIEIKMNLPTDTQNTKKKVAGLVTYTLSWKVKNNKGDEQTKVLEALDELRDLQSAQGLPQVAPVPPPVIYPGAQTGEPQPQTQQPQRPGVKPGPDRAPTRAPASPGGGQQEQPQQQPPNQIDLDQKPANDNAEKDKEEEQEKLKAAKIGIGAAIGAVILWIAIEILTKGRGLPSGGGGFGGAPVPITMNFVNPGLYGGGRSVGAGRSMFG